MVTNIRLRRAELQALGIHLLNLVEDETKPYAEIKILNPNEVAEYVPPQLTVEEAFLHCDGEWATYADMTRTDPSAETARRAAASE